MLRSSLVMDGHRRRGWIRLPVAILAGRGRPALPISSSTGLIDQVLVAISLLALVVQVTPSLDDVAILASRRRPALPSAVSPMPLGNSMLCSSLAAVGQRCPAVRRISRPARCVAILADHERLTFNIHRLPAYLNSPARLTSFPAANPICHHSDRTISLGRRCVDRQARAHSRKSFSRLGGLRLFPWAVCLRRRSCSRQPTSARSRRREGRLGPP